MSPTLGYTVWLRRVIVSKNLVGMMTERLRPTIDQGVFNSALSPLCCDGADQDAVRCQTNSSSKGFLTEVHRSKSMR